MATHHATLEITADTRAAEDSIAALQAKLHLRCMTLADVPDEELAEALKEIQQGIVMRAPKHGGLKEFRPDPLSDADALAWAQQLKRSEAEARRQP